MSDDEADPELIALLRERFGLNGPDPNAPPETKVLESAQYIYDNSIDVAIDMRSTKLAAAIIYSKMQEKSYSTKTWREHELHPKVTRPDDETALNFIFTMDLLNFCFWSEKSEDERFQVEWEGRRWTGYWSLVACLQRALAEDIPITTPTFWTSDECTDDVLKNVFRSETEEEIPLLQDRMDVLREAGRVLDKEFDGSVAVLVEDAKNSAARLVNLLAEHFPCFNDVHKFERKTVKLLKRAQIFVADVWAAFDKEGYGRFEDIDKITVFADYRIPQMLHTLGVLMYSPALQYRIIDKKLIESGHSWEVQIRGCTIHAVELIRREIVKEHLVAEVSAILIDFFLYDTAKEMERVGKEDKEGKEGEGMMTHHRTRSIWY